ncbi:hypothetical protein Tsubulata_045649 [Turnera subulata]|uniref:Uncharacterized protein n=1 Tax=Turnera subulata TaxID=218843 RepID=A0A9Q0JNU4_9ROSI|nr:hypothetical protein Tsubulata_045649 [Turnera subulata]
MFEGNKMGEVKQSCSHACLGTKSLLLGETIKNLNAELARGTKLKCTKCGLKGADLGCYLKILQEKLTFSLCSGNLQVPMGL